MKATELTLVKCSPVEARELVLKWHSRLPVTQKGPWKLAFVAETPTGELVAGALWHNPSARMLPNEWMELRRLAVSPDAPPHTASWMLGAMRKWIKHEMPGCPRLLSYQDVEVHTGTIYRAAGWEPAFFSKPRIRDRSPNRVGTTRKYRSDINGIPAAGAGKIRWEVTP